MDELPGEARRLLDMARDAHEPPDPEARARVRQRLAMTLAAGAGMAVAGKAVAASSATVGSAGAASAAKAGLFASATAKLAATGGVLVLAAAATFGVQHLTTSPPSKNTARPVAAHVAERTAPSPSEPTPPVPSASSGQAPPAPTPAHDTLERTPQPVQRRTADHASGANSLASELTLLQAASHALDANQPAQAAAKLAEYKRRFAHGQLRSEGAGLTALTACMRGQRGASAAARSFLMHQPASLLAARIMAACKLGSTP